ncbi:WASH complex subunit 2 isoform X2 [Thrips palmi]|uniref:WASH complex subunit 2 isoform X2 n=1 Tax=Thrips palmi TaxID=161013 RepID=A0A6P8ZRJ3_THRPL|nr:WASH complex subunit 2 isoform X2 [Thrips palmi]
MNGSAGDPAGSTEAKPWERSWSTDEMRQNAHAWNLAGDTGLLKHLQEFSQTVLARTHTTEKALDTLVEETSTLTSDVNTTNNKFLCLANTQFVENRVYDDDDKETPQDESVPKTQSKEETEARMLQKVREALSLSVAVLDTMFEPVEIQASDSEGEIETEQQGTKTLILEPHNPYIHRPLPHLIGSEAFMSDDHIGLADSPSDEEEQSLKTGVDYDMDVTSDSDNDFTPIGSNKRKIDMYSSRSSVSTGPEKISRKIEPTDSVQGAGNPSTDVPEPSSVQKHGQDNLFASQLAAKLDKIAHPATSSNFTPEKTTSDNLFGGALSENEDDGLFSGNSGLFSGRPRLFDDLENTNNSLWGPDEVTAKKATLETENVEQPSKLPPKSDNLFSSNGSDEEDSLFSFAKSGKIDLPKPSPILQKPKPQRPGIVTSTPNKGLDNSSETKPRSISNIKGDLERTSSHVVEDNAQSPTVPTVQRETPDKKLAGAVPMFGKANVLEGLKAKLPRRQSSSSSESSSSDPAENSSIPSVDHTSDEVNNYDQGWNGSASSSQKSQAPSQGMSSPVFNSTSLPKNEIIKIKKEPSSISSVPSASNDDIDDIFGSKPLTFSPPYSQPISGGLFADVDDEEDDLFAVSPAPKRTETKEIPDHIKKQVNDSLLKEEETKPVNSNEDAESVKQISSKPPQTIVAPKPAPGKSFTHDIYSTVPPPLKSENKIKKPVSLFDDSDSGEDELLFSSASSAGSRRSQASTDILSAAAASSIEKKSLTKKGLFDDDDALFGSTRNDPDVDIFGLSKSPAESKPLGDNRKLPDTSLFKEESSPAIDNNSSLQNSSVLNSEHKDLLKPELKPIFQDDSFVRDNCEKENFVNSEPTLPKTKLFDAVDGDDVESDLFSDISVHNINNVPSSASTSKPNKVHDTSPIETSPPKASIGEQIKKIGEENQLPIDEEQVSNVERNSEKSLSIKNESSPQINAPSQHRKPEPPRTLNIRKETDPGLGLFDDSNDEDDDLFSSSSKKESQKPALLPKESATPKAAVKPLTAVKPSTAVISDTTPAKKVDIPQDEPKTLDVADGAVVSVSKLRNTLLAGGNGQPGLKIDPRALLPGQKPPPRRTPPKEQTPEPGPTAPSISESKEPPARSAESGVGFDQQAPISATLTSVNKDRAKLGVKRRPPSNKARREAARASQNLEQSDRDSPLSPDASSIWTDSIGGVNSNGNSNNSVLSPSTDEDDLFGVPQDLPAEYEDPSSTSADIFSSPTILSPVPPVNNDTKPERSNFTDQIKEFQDSLQKNASLFLPPDDIDDDSLSDKLFDPVLETAPVVSKTPVLNSSTVVNSAHVVKSTDVVDSSPLVNAVPVIDTAPVVEASPVVDTAPVTDSTLDVDTTPVVNTSSVANTAPMAVENEKTSSTEDHSSQKTVPDPSSVPSQHPKTSLNDSPKSVPSKDESAAPALDPLNKQEQTTMDEESNLFGSDDASESADDSNALFPFVKKKLESKQSSSQPLFSQTPALPSKTDISSTKPNLRGLDEIEDNDLFSSTNHKSQIPIKKPPVLQNKEVKTWNFSDEDDDDLFQSSSKSGPLNPSQNAVATSKGKNSASPEPFVSEKITKTIKSSKPKANNGLFSDENDDDDDLFSKPPPLLKSKVKEKNSKSSLFDDDDDDLFGSKQPKSFKTPNPSKLENMPGTSTQSQASSKVKKGNVNVFDDPLKAFEND